MRHRKRGRRLGRSASHRRAMFRNLASALILTERDAEFDPNPPKVKGRIITTLQKAKEIRPLVEKCVTIARRSLKHRDQAEAFASTAERGSDQWKQWRQSAEWREWCEARAPVVAAQRRALRLLGDREAVKVLFEEIAPRFADRDGGYTRVMRLAKPRLGDAGTRAILEFVGRHDRVAEVSQRPSFEDAAEEAAEPAPQEAGSTGSSSPA
ncbi:MAG: bL17 family ribosomal protein [Pirellulaceae bacterium]